MTVETAMVSQYIGCTRRSAYFLSVSDQFNLAYMHINFGKVVQGVLVARKCPARIKIFSPLNREDRHAIVLLDGPHNHPRFPSTKLSREGKDKYEEAIKVNGVARSTVMKCDTGV